MSVIDSRTKYLLGVRITPTGMYLLTTNMNNIQQKLNVVVRTNFITILDSAFKNKVDVDLLRYKGEVPKRFTKIDSITSQELNFLESQLSKIKSHNTRKFEDILPLLKTFFPNQNINQYYITRGIIYDTPFVTVNGVQVCYFTPKFENVMDVSRIKIIDNCFVYDYTKPIYILSDVAQRHTPSILRDRLIINLKTGKITCEYKDVINDRYCDYTFEFNRSTYNWEKVRLQTTVINGYKIA